MVLQNFRPGVMEKMGFGYDRLCELKPDIILISVSGFGQYGPYRDRPAFDPLGQAMSGLMSLTGAPVGTPLGAATSLVDRYTSLHATIGALAGLHHRDQAGEGQVLDCCLWDSCFTLGEIHVPGATIKMSKTPGRVAPVPTPGQHTDELLSSLLGYDAANLAELREAKVIG